MAGQLDIGQLPPPPAEGTQLSLDALPAPAKQSPGIVASALGFAQPAISGINAAVPDLLGMPMDTATKVANLGKATVEAGMLAVGKLPPPALDPSDPAKVWGTSEWLKRQGERALPGVFESQSTSRGAQVAHFVGELIGPGGAAAAATGVRLVTAAGKTALRAIDAEDATELLKPKVQLTGETKVIGKPHYRFTVPQAQAGLRSAMHEVHQEAAPPALADALKRAGKTPVTVNLQRALQDVLRAVSPESLGKNAKQAAAVVGSRIARAARSRALWNYQSKTRLGYWEKAGAQKAADFIHAFETGQTVPPEFKDIADQYKLWNARIVNQDLRNGIQYTEEENYLSHMFMDPQGVRAWMTKRFGKQWTDPGFTKGREFNLYAEAANAGFRLRYSNPEDIMLARQAASDRAEAQVQALADFEKHGLASAEVDNPFKDGVRRRSPNGQMYWVQGNADAFLHNTFDEPGLWSDQGVRGQVFRGMMALKNQAVGWRLSLSGFHALHVLHIDNAAYAANAYKEMLAGSRSPLSALREQLKSGLLYRSFWENPRAGGRIRAAWRGEIPESQLNVADAQLLSDMADGGFVPEMSDRYRAESENSFRTAIAKHNVSAVWKLPGALIHSLSKPLFEWWIPNLKAASYANEVRSWRELNPVHADDQIVRQQAFRRIAKSIDNRYGEMNYEMLFWNHYVKDISTLNTLSLGWQLGFLREFGGGAMDLGQFALSKEGKLAQIAEGKLDRPLFSAQYLTSAALYGGLLTWAMTGQKPQSLEDYIYPAVGKNPDGTPKRVSTMFYTREIAGLMDHMRKQGVVSGLSQLVQSKSSGVFGLVDEWATGLNDYGQEYRDPSGTALQKLQQTLAYTLHSFEPISLEGTKAQDAKGRVLNVAGFRPAPSYVTESDTEGRIWDAYDKYVQPRETPFEAVQRRQEIRQLRTVWQRGDPQADMLLQQVANKYNMSGRQVRGLVKELNSPESASMAAFKDLSQYPGVQRRLLDRMTPEERKQFLPYANKDELRYSYEPPR